MKKMNLYFLSALLVILISGCQPTRTTSSHAEDKTGKPTQVARKDVDKLFIVNCLLPGVLRKLGGQLTYLTARRPIRTSAINCEIRGGEYTAYNRSDYRTSLKVWLEKAKQGDPNAQVNVGEIYEKGLGLAPDYETARLWYEKAATSGNDRAEINLGYLYEKGLGVTKDLVKAINWYRRASGLSNDNLKFASSIDIAIAASTQKEVKKLKRQVVTSRQQSKILRNKLSRSNNKLLHRKKQLTLTLNRLKQLQANNQQYLATESINDNQRLLREREIQNLKTNISQQNNVIVSLQKNIDDNQQQLDEKVILASAKATDDLTTLAGPSINILRYPLVLTRGLPTLKLPLNQSKFNIIGRVKAPAGILGFTVNGKKRTINSNGKFNISLPASNNSTRVKMVAIDKGGRIARLIFSVEEATVITTPATRKALSIVNPKNIKTTISFGNYHALIIGNNNYTHFPKLKTAINDARKTESILREKYGFKTKLILDADRYSILTALNEISSTLTDSDNLLIYYAGHGEINNQNQRGYWLPIDAETSNSANWISNLDITDILNVINAKHVLVVADSCYSGTMSSTSQTRISLELDDVQRRARWIRVMSKTRARIVMTSGGIKPVLDSGGGKHSVFAKAFHTALINNQSVIEGYQLYQQIANNVQAAAAKYNIEQIPRYAPVKHGGGLGEFFFVPK